MNEFQNQPPVQITFEHGDELYTIWSPSGDRILNKSNEKGNKAFESYTRTAASQLE